MRHNMFSNQSITSRCAGAVSKEMAIAFALALIISASLVFNWSLLFGGARTPEMVVEMGFQCLACDHSFTMTNQEFQARRIDRDVLNANPALTVDMVDCPTCGRQHTATQQLQCPACDKYFLPARVNLRVASTEQEPPEPVCPHCGTNMNEWHRKNHP